MRKAGDVIGDRYIIVRPLGEGSTGKVYLAQKSGNENCLLALKEFDIRGMSDDEKTEYRELFYREAEILQIEERAPLCIYSWCIMKESAGQNTERH
ncbi:MAG: hypothetical protein AB2L14_03265 [Candidatus Xenobiia bacterium LiM19]